MLHVYIVLSVKYLSVNRRSDTITVEIILYCFVVGATTKQTDGLKFLYEGSDEFSVLPTFVVAPALTAWLGTTVVGVDPSQVLHYNSHSLAWYCSSRRRPVSGTSLQSSQPSLVLQ